MRIRDMGAVLHVPAKGEIVARSQEPDQQGAVGVKREKITLAGVEVELHEAGEGAPILFLHSGQGFVPAQQYVGMLASSRRLIAPSHPGFGQSGLPDWLDSADDISYLYLELMDRLNLDAVDLVGCSLGGWIAAEMAVKAPQRFRKMVLVSPVGVKTGPTDRLDIPDIFAMPQAKVNELLFHDPSKFQIDPAKLSDEELTVIARNRETLALFVWEPWMHDPKLVRRLHRVTAPTLFLRGESDGLVSAEYVARFAKLIPDAHIETIGAAGHALQAEQPAAFAQKVLAFLGA
jgi:pimeloyl-ACP methyl ester carboxylesterase